jgi:hypothetical protein
MSEREKVIKGLECCILRDPDDHARCSQCSYESNCVNRLKMDALELLKDPDRVRVVRCSDCRFWEPPTDIEADDGSTAGRCRNDYAPCQNQQTDMNWFCADGEREE